MFYVKSFKQLREQVLKIPKYVKAQNQPKDYNYFEIFELCTPVTQSQDLQQLVLFYYVVSHFFLGLHPKAEGKIIKLGFYS